MARHLHLSLVLATGLAVGCGPHVLISTGTTLGLKASPGDPQGGRPPQITLGYKRAEAAIVPTGKAAARNACANQTNADAYSTLASFFFRTEWFGETKLTSFIATGFAAGALGRPDQIAAEPTASRGPGVQPKNSFADALVRTLAAGDPPMPRDSR